MELGVSIPPPRNSSTAWRNNFAPRSQTRFTPPSSAKTVSRSPMLASGIDALSCAASIASLMNADNATSTLGPSASGGATWARWLNSFAKSSSRVSAP
jgi:hypothetical protein